MFVFEVLFKFVVVHVHFKTLQKCNLANEDVFAALCAAIIHDYNHPGINNNYHIKYVFLLIVSQMCL